MFNEKYNKIKIDIKYVCECKQNIKGYQLK